MITATQIHEAFAVERKRVSAMIKGGKFETHELRPASAHALCLRAFDDACAQGNYEVIETWSRRVEGVRPQNLAGMSYLGDAIAFANPHFDLCVRMVEDGTLFLIGDTEAGIVAVEVSP